MNARTLVIGTAANVAGTGLAVVATLILARLMPAEEFGAYRLGIAFTTLMLPVFMLGAERHASRIIQEGRGAELPFVIRCCALSLCCGALLALALMTPLRERVMGGSLPPWPFAIAAATILPAGLYNLANTIWRHAGDTARPQLHQFFLQRCAKSAAVLAASGVSRQSGAMLLVTLVVQVALMLLAWRALRGWLAALPRAPLPGLRRLATLAEMARTGLPLLLFALFERLDVLLIGASRGAAAAGGFDLALMVGFVAIYPTMSLVKTAEPFLCACRTDPAPRAVLRGLVRRATLLSLAVVLAVALGGDWIDRFFAPGGVPVARLALLIALGLVGAGAMGPGLEYLQVNGRGRQVTLCFLALGLPLISAKLLLAPHAGLEAIAAALGGSILLFKAVLAFCVWRTDGVVIADLPAAALVLALFAAALAGLFP